MEAYLAKHPDEESGLNRARAFLGSIETRLVEPRMKPEVLERIMTKCTQDTPNDSTPGAVASALRWGIALALIIGSLTILVALVEGRLGSDRARVLVSLAVVVLGGTLVVGDWTLPQSRRQRGIGLIGIGCAIVAVTVSFFLIWSTTFQTHRFVWKAWWLFSTTAVHCVHVLAILRAHTSPWTLLVIRNVTLGAVVPFATILALMTFRHNVLSMPAPWLTVLLAVLGAAQVLGSGILWIRARPRSRAARRLPRKVLRAAWAVAVPVLVFAGGFYSGRLSGPQTHDHAAAFLAGLPPEIIDRQIQADLPRLQEVVKGVERLREKVWRLHETLQKESASEGRKVFTPDEDDEIRALFFSYLSCRSALMRMVGYYQGFTGLSDDRQRARCFLVGYTAGVVCYSVSLALVSTYADDGLVRRKLNEPEPRWEIPGGMFDQILWSVASKGNIDLFEEMSAYYEHGADWRDCGLDRDDVAFLESTIEYAVAAVKTNPRYGQRPSAVATILQQVEKDAYKPVYAMQRLVSTWIGDTRLVSRAPCISPAQVEEMRSMLRPGDVILERRNWFLSNAFLPGFWPHAALYVGTYDDLKQLGIADDPVVRSRLEEYQKPAHDGELKVVIEAISEGVSFSSLSEATLADYIAVLRPLLSEREKAQAIVRAFSHQGKPYDFEFDFFSSDKLVCTELVYRSYEGMLHFDLVKVMGRMTLPALKIAEKHRQERDNVGQEFDFVLFLDTPRGSDQAVFAQEKTFLETIDRPRAFNE